MPHIAITGVAGGTFGYSGQINWYRPGLSQAASAFTQITLPTGANVVDSRGASINYRDRCYIVGQTTDNIVIDEHFRCHRMGIQAPTVVPGLTIGAGALTTIGYITFYDELTDERSSLSGGRQVNSSNTTRAWSGLPTSSPDARVTHLEGWVSIDGGLPRLAWRRQLSNSTTVSESTATLALGEAFTVPFDRFPRCTVNALYHDRQVMAGDAENPDTIYLGAIFKPERWEGLSFRTRNGEPVVGLAVHRDTLVVLCPTSSYTIQGYTEDDMVLNLSEPELGCCNHHGVQIIHGNLWIPNDKGIFLYNGAWHQMMPHGHREWRKQFELNPTLFESGFGAHDPNENIYKFCVNLDNSGTTTLFQYRDIPNPNSDTILTVYWVADYSKAVPQIEGKYAAPRWSFDVRSRKDTCAALMGNPGGTRQDLFTGSCDGKIYKENAEDDPSDQNDAYDKYMTIRTGHFLFNDPGGDAEEGKKLHRLWTYVESEESTWETRIFGGDEEAWKMVWDIVQVPLDTKADSAVATGIGLFTYAAVAESVHVFPGVELAVGRGFTFLITALGAVRLRFRGFGGKYGRGPKKRGYKEVTGGA